jgi:cytochrome c553
MRNLLWMLLIGLAPIAVPILTFAAERPDWAFPVTDKVQPPLPPDEQPHTVPGSDQSYTRKQIDDLFNPPDWYPDLHPPMPQIVAHGEGTAVRACGACHLPTGTGHDESAYIAALPAGYFVRQMVDYKSGARKGSGSMTAIAKAISEEGVHAAADYFASLKPRPWIRVVETDTVPKTYVGPGNKRLRLPGGETEPIGNRIIEIPEDEEVVLNRDPRSGFIAMVPKGSIAKGQTLVTTGADKTVPCAICHGPTLKGLGDVPPIAGRQANYVVRQLFSIQDGTRGGISSALMQQVVERLTADDMLAIAAYTASRQP